MEKSIIAENIVSIANEKGYKLTTIADRCGYDLNKFSDMLNNRTPITSLDVDIISKVLGTNSDELLKKRSESYRNKHNRNREVAFLTVKDLAEKFNLCTATIYKLTKEGMPHIRFGRAYRFDKEEVSKYLNDKK